MKRIKMIKTKKGIEWRVIIILIIVLAFLIFGLILYGNLGSKIREYLTVMFG